MTREELEHIIRASGDITDQYEFVIVGSQSILGAVPRPEDVFTVSMEADIYPLQAPELADRIDGAIGESSQFHETYGYYAQGVGPETACVPAGWMQRVHRIQNRNTQDRIGYCLDVLDLFLAKVVAAREKDREFCIALLQYGLCEPGSRPGTRGQHAPRCQGAADLAGDDTAVGKECRSFDCLSCWRAG